MARLKNIFAVDRIQTAEATALPTEPQPLSTA